MTRDDLTAAEAFALARYLARQHPDAIIVASDEAQSRGGKRSEFDDILKEIPFGTTVDVETQRRLEVASVLQACQKAIQDLRSPMNLSWPKGQCRGVVAGTIYAYVITEANHHLASRGWVINDFQHSEVTLDGSPVWTLEPFNPPAGYGRAVPVTFLYLFALAGDGQPK